MKIMHAFWPMAALALLLSAGAAGRGQTPAVAAPAPGARTAMPEYIEDFFLSEAVRSEDRNEMQITLAAFASRRNGSAADGSSVALDLEYGITNRLQLALELPYGIRASETSELPPRWSAMSVGVLYQFIRSDRPFALSAGATAGVPLNTQGDASFDPLLLMAKTFGVTQVHFSVEPEIGAEESSLAYNLAAVRPWPHHLYPTLEFNGRRNGGVNSFYGTPGLYRRLPHRLEVGLGVPVGMGTHSSRIGAAFNMTLEIGGDEDRD
jgi:hypothetical protein